MLTEKGAIVVMTGRCPTCETHHVHVHHRFFPEISGTGDTPKEAAENLIQRLAAEAGVRADAWHQQGVDQTIAELRAFVERCEPTLI